MSIKQQRETHFDSLRGVAALLVTINHFFAAFYPYTVFGPKSSYSHADFEAFFHMPPLGMFVAGPFDVSLFFILSGYVLSYTHIGNASPLKLIAAIIKRPFRLGGLVIITVLISAVLWYFNLFYNHPFIALTHPNQWFSSFWINHFSTELLLQNISTHLFSASSLYNPPLWTIDLELKGSILVFLSLLLIGNLKQRLWILLILVVLTKGSCYSGFLLGVVFADLQKNHQINHTLDQHPTYKWLIIIFMSILFITFASYPAYVDDTFLKDTIYAFLPSGQRFRIIYPMIGAFAVFVLVIVSTRLKSILNNSVLKFLGDISFSVYTIHFLILGSFSSWLFIQLYPRMDYFSAFVVVTTTGILATIGIAWGMTKWMDLPIIKLTGVIDKGVQKLMSKSPLILKGCAYWERITKGFPSKPNYK